MKFTSVALACAALGLTHANPVAKRAVTDADILQYALTLEHLEASFYEEGMKNYTKKDFVDAGLNEAAYSNLKMIAGDEKSHEQFLTKALSAAGAKPVERCTYNFPSTDVKSFLALGNVLEGVGVSAYLGAAAHIMNDTYLTAAGSILTVEARHSAYLRAALGEAASPQPFDNPLDFNEVYTVASPFISSCPESNQMLPVKAFPALVMPTMKPAMEGSKVQLMTGSGFDMSMDTKDLHAAFITVTGPVWAPVSSDGEGKFTVTIPKGVAGQSYVVLTKGNTKATDDTIVAGPAIVEVGPMVGSMNDCADKGKGASSMAMSSMGMAMSSMSMPMPTGTSAMKMGGSMASGSMTASSMSMSASPTYNAASGTGPAGIAGVVGAAMAAAGMLV
ncbi:hypothetical protein N7492_008699 [Penicillium capsulatum]|uniref:Uncharacterized protein n=1 Tax=Penicillium capsulatum TaxID=69766 RepID=A0A9W9HR77_9EURO|nr:hypothetical protein N7492_008699 [Penicillium capsulatum]KAJ6106103.1 hypothetical protein N7512_009620 [Penicillium capsulatum]